MWIVLDNEERSVSVFMYFFSALQTPNIIPFRGFRVISQKLGTEGKTIWLPQGRLRNILKWRFSEVNASVESTDAKMTNANEFVSIILIQCWKKKSYFWEKLSKETPKPFPFPKTTACSKRCCVPKTIHDRVLSNYWIKKTNWRQKSGRSSANRTGLSQRIQFNNLSGIVKETSESRASIIWTQTHHSAVSWLWSAWLRVNLLFDCTNRKKKSWETKPALSTY